MLFDGLQIIEDPNMVTPYEDWSQVRSPSRAARRRHKHPQRIVTRYRPMETAYRIGGRIVMHPELARLLRNHPAVTLVAPVSFP
jgi:hypothetical protein